MRGVEKLIPLTLIALSVCASQSFARQSRSASTFASCKPQAPGALIVRTPFLNVKPLTHADTTQAFKFANATFVQGRCVAEIQLFNVGEVMLSSSERLLVREDGSVDYYPHRPLPDKHDLPLTKISSLPGYVLVIAEKIWGSLPTDGNRLHYIGVFKGRSNYVIARFDMLNGKASRSSELLFRSKKPILAFDYLPFPDAPLGQIGFVQRVGRDAAWLYRYDWHHGQISPLVM